jgi:hypothetical protein
LLVKLTPRNVNLGNGRFAMFNKERDISDADDFWPYKIHVQSKTCDQLLRQVRRGSKQRAILRIFACPRPFDPTAKSVI